MDELKQIREALDSADDHSHGLCITCKVAFDKAYAALSRLEAREAETPKEAAKLVWDVDYICNDPEYKSASDSRIMDAAAEIERYVQSRIAAAKKAEPDFISQALNEGDGVYRP